MRSHRRCGARRPWLPVLAVGGALLATGCDAGVPTGTPPATRTPSAQASTLDLSDLPISRGPFCARLDNRAAARALDGPVARRSSYRAGDRVEIVPGVTDVAGEYDCTFDAASGAQARVWVFARPVTPREARDLLHDAASRPGCGGTDSLRFGSPSSTLVCQETTPALSVVSLRGLFGDAWLSCRLSEPRGDRRGTRDRTADLVSRARRWCADVATTLGARP